MQTPPGPPPGHIPCPHCAATVPARAALCPNCGERIARSGPSGPRIGAIIVLVLGYLVTSLSGVACAAGILLATLMDCGSNISVSNPQPHPEHWALFVYGGVGLVVGIVITLGGLVLLRRSDPTSPRR